MPKHAIFAKFTAQPGKRDELVEALRSIAEQIENSRDPDKHEKAAALRQAGSLIVDKSIDLTATFLAKLAAHTAGLG